MSRGRELLRESAANAETQGRSGEEKAHVLVAFSMFSNVDPIVRGTYVVAAFSMQSTTTIYRRMEPVCSLFAHSREACVLL